MRRRVSREKMLRRRIRIVCVAVMMFFVGCIGFKTFLVSAHENTDDAVYTYYKSITIQSGDTLWDIAEETMTSEYDSVSEYVEVLKDMNGLDSDDIQAGQHLVIAYEDTELK